VEPAVAAAREGVTINDFQGYILEVVRPIYESVPPYDRARTGVRLKQPELADTMETLAREGEACFYRGDLARRLVEACREAGGHLSAADLERYRVIERPALSLQRGADLIVTNPLPSAGGVLIRHSLSMLEEGHAGPVELVQALIATRRERAALLAGAEQVTRGTTHISVADAAGNIAAMTLSNGEGSGCVIPGTGIMLNNMLGEEDINPDGVGNWTPDVRLGSMMAPTLILGARHRYALGSGGSNRIRSAMFQVIVHLLDHGLSAEDAIAAPRLHLEDDLLSLEPGFDEATLADMVPTLHRWDDRNLFFGGVHVVAHHDDGRFEAAGDLRRGGVGALAT
jgi:gamma-glutamyltranspeptidase/glutathione hydrolase